MVTMLSIGRFIKRLPIYLGLSLMAWLSLFTGLSSGNPGDVIKSFPAPSDVSRPEGLTWDGSYLWNISCIGSTCANENLFRINPLDGSVVNSYTLPFFDPDGLTWDGTHLLVSAGPDYDKKIYLVNPSDGSWSIFLDSLPGTGDTDGGLAWDGDHLWLGRDLIYEIDVNTGGVLNSFPYPSAILGGGLTWGGEYLIHSSDKIYYLNPIDGSVIYSINSPGPSPSGLAWDGEFIWVGDHTLRMIYQIEPIPLGNLVIFPPSGTMVSTTGFDLTLIAKLPIGVNIVGGSATLDGVDVTKGLLKCIEASKTIGTINPPLNGLTFRCPGLTGGDMGSGRHIFSTTMDLGNGTSITDTVTWEVLSNTE